MYLLSEPLAQIWSSLNKRCIHNLDDDEPWPNKEGKLPRVFKKIQFLFLLVSVLNQFLIQFLLILTKYVDLGNFYKNVLTASLLS